MKKIKELEGFKKEQERQLKKLKTGKFKKVTISVELSFNAKDFAGAVAWCKRHGYTYLRDGEYASMLLGAMNNKNIVGDIENAEIWSVE